MRKESRLIRVPGIHTILICLTALLLVLVAITYYRFMYHDNAGAAEINSDQEVTFQVTYCSEGEVVTNGVCGTPAPQPAATPSPTPVASASPTDVAPPAPTITPAPESVTSPSPVGTTLIVFGSIILGIIVAISLIVYKVRAARVFVLALGLGGCYVVGANIAQAADGKAVLTITHTKETVAKSHVYHLKITNGSKKKATEIVATATINSGTYNAHSASNNPTESGKTLVWRLGTQDPGTSQTLTVPITPASSSTSASSGSSSSSTKSSNTSGSSSSSGSVSSGGASSGSASGGTSSGGTTTGGGTGGSTGGTTGSDSTGGTTGGSTGGSSGGSGGSGGTSPTSVSCIIFMDTNFGTGSTVDSYWHAIAVTGATDNTWYGFGNFNTADAGQSAMPNCTHNTNGSWFFHTTFDGVSNFSGTYLPVHIEFTISTVSDSDNNGKIGYHITRVDNNAVVSTTGKNTDGSQKLITRISGNPIRIQKH